MSLTDPVPLQKNGIPVGIKFFTGGWPDTWPVKTWLFALPRMQGGAFDEEWGQAVFCMSAPGCQLHNLFFLAETVLIGCRQMSDEQLKILMLQNADLHEPIVSIITERGGA